MNENLNFDYFIFLNINFILNNFKCYFITIKINKKEELLKNKNFLIEQFSNLDINKVFLINFNSEFNKKNTEHFHIIICLKDEICLNLLNNLKKNIENIKINLIKNGYSLLNTHKYIYKTKNYLNNYKFYNKELLLTYEKNLIFNEELINSKNLFLNFY